MDHTLLRQKLQTLAAFPDIRPEAAWKFGELLQQLPDVELLRINPLQFAVTHNLDETETLNLFMYGAKIGLFDFEWNLICPACGAIMKSHPSIGSVERDMIHCAICDMDIEVDLSDFVEVAFSLNPSVSAARMNPFTDRAAYSRYFFSRNYRMTPELSECFDQCYVFEGFYTIMPDDTLKIRLTAQPNDFFRLASPDSNILVRLQCTDTSAHLPQIIDLDMLVSGFSSDTVQLPAGEITLNITSHLPRPAGLQLTRVNLKKREQFMGVAPIFVPFLTGKMLLNNQVFRDTFRIQSLPRDLKLKVSNMTILFTDLKGSTALYEKTGDMTAYNLVQAHFDLLKAATRKHSGAIIKTIGDAIMAAFSKPANGVRSALQMVTDIRHMNVSGKTFGEEIAIKVGLNAGTALAVTANDMLDYFGQSVNLAARVQGLAEGGEIWLTEAMFDDEIARLLETAQYRTEKHSALLKGVSAPTIVYKCFQ